jgi:hypothetical protein
MGFPLLQKPTEMCVGRQINVLGSYWTVNKDRMSDQEENSLYKWKRVRSEKLWVDDPMSTAYS